MIYAPLRTAPVVHVRVLYHVGSRDERPDRQGFAHMFEHMMFRGSAHVPPEQHMKLVGNVGGNSNAFTSFDQTVYVNTLPSSHLDMALYLEADRMASFKVSEEIYKTERNVVAEEWRMKQNRPYGNLYEDLLARVFTTHSYRWTPIGNMEHLAAAPVNELQAFFNTYYVPNNAVLVIAGDFETAAAKEMVHRYFGWIPRGNDVPRDIPPEPEQTEARAATVPQRVPLPMVLLAYKLPPYKADENDALSLVADVLGGGESSRLDQLLVTNDKPLAVNVFANAMALEDGGAMIVGATVLQGKDPKQVEAMLRGAIEDVIATGVTQAELDKVRTQARVQIVKGRQTAENLASELGKEALLAGDPNRVNTELARLDAVTTVDLRAAAERYLAPHRATAMTITPDPTGATAKAAATQAAAAATQAVAPRTAPVTPRVVEFPRDYPTSPPAAAIPAGRPFDKGTEFAVNGVRTVVLSEHRLPLVTWGLTLRRGSHADPKGKEGLARLTAELLQRGAGGLSYQQVAEDLDRRGIGLSIDDQGDVTRISGLSTANELPHAIRRARAMLREPALSAEEFEKLKAQTVSGLRVSLETPTSVASNELNAALYGDSPRGRAPTPASVADVTLDDVRQFYQTYYKPTDAILTFSGDVTTEQGRAMAEQLLGGWASGAPLPAVEYGAATTQAAGRRIVLVDNPGAKGAVVRMAVPAYDIRSDEKYPGAIASRVLTGGIDARLMKYVRAERGLVYSAHAIFSPTRHGGEFIAGTDNKPENTADAVRAVFKVLDDLRGGDVTPQELTDAKTRVAGGMLMQLQTKQAQANFRAEGILNDYPLDYYDAYPQKVAAVPAADVRDVMNRYVDPERFTIVVVADAKLVKDELAKLGEVTVVPMPGKRPEVTSTDSATRPVEMIR
ncbi:MAG TPA: pitrilysin family protein [Tepidisphaeraceae bacterium]|nr:pitrilysin family protein [Tepidisphaeraceae bacterium]